VSRARKAALGLITAALFGALAEGALRWGLGPPPPPVRVFRIPAADQGYVVVDADGRGTLPYQRRPAQPPFSRLAAAPRFAVLGESSVHEGTAGLRGGGEFPDLLAASTGFEVLNLGAPGLDSHQITDIAAEILEWDLTGLVLYAGHNDLGNTWFMERYASVHRSSEVRALALLEQSQVYCQLRRMIDPARLRGAGGQSGRRPSLELDPGLSEERREISRRHFETNLRRIAFHARRAGVPLVMVTPVSNLFLAPTPGCPAEGDCAADLFEAGTARMRGGADPEGAAALLERARRADPTPVRAPSEFTETVRRVAAEEGALLVDAEADLPRYPGMNAPGNTLFQDQMHLTREGHQQMATLLKPTLVSLSGASPR
jgi:lysophospholipase L1-like esterase